MAVATIDRTYDATPEQVWQAWADVDRLQRWWGCAVDMLWTVHEWDFQVGGTIRVSMDFDGVPYVVDGTFVEVSAPGRLAFDWEDGQRITVVIEPAGAATRMTVEHAGLPDDERHGIVDEGWTASVGQLAAVV